ncbi:hypothetical protein Fmac_012960 [Flemingia macrophylla]|uniref:Uncharacterized protein n=1 Tax=Flemingia macrophylla TaxID=520843 RepID=A0ABD1MRU3_9FABA
MKYKNTFSLSTGSLELWNVPLNINKSFFVERPKKEPSRSCLLFFFSFFYLLMVMSDFD